MLVVITGISILVAIMVGLNIIAFLTDTDNPPGLDPNLYYNSIIYNMSVGISDES